MVPLISVVDDDHSVRDSLSSLIRSVGLSVEVFGSAEAFVTSEALGRTDCVILDVRMPGMSGLELQRLLAESPACAGGLHHAHASDDDIRSRALKTARSPTCPNP